MLAPPAQQQPMPQQPAAPPMGGPPMPQAPMMGGMMAPMAPPPPVKKYDVKLRRCIKGGRMRVMVVPREDFLIASWSTTIDEEDGLFYGNRARETRSALKLRYPKSKDIIDDLPAWTTGQANSSEDQARRDNRVVRNPPTTDKSTELVEIYECYVKVDYDGTGIAEWYQVVTVRGAVQDDDKHLLDISKWGGDLPYSDIVPEPVPHRWEGRSVYDETQDVQRIKTVLLRQVLDNLYQVNNPMEAADRTRIDNPDALVNRELGATVWTNGPPAGIIEPLAVPFVAKDTFPVLEYIDQIKENRTGIGRASMALDPNVLQNQTATSAQITQDIKFSKVEFYARNIAEIGLKRVFKCLLRLFVENQRDTIVIRLRDKFVPMDPKGWNADMDCTVNVGLGTGSKDRDMAMLQGVAQKQELAIQGLQDPFNPYLNLGHLFETYRKLSEAAGIKNPEQFFPEITQEQIQQVAAKKAQNPPPNPEAMKAQAQMQLEQAKLQASQQSEAAKMQADQQRQQMEFQRETQMMQQKAEIEKIQAQADIATQDRKMQAEIQLAREKAQLDSALQQQEHALKLELMQREDARKDREFSLRQAEAQANHQRAGEAHGQKLAQMAAAQNAKPKAKDE